VVYRHGPVIANPVILISRILVLWKTYPNKILAYEFLDVCKSLKKYTNIIDIWEYANAVFFNLFQLKHYWGFDRTYRSAFLNPNFPRPAFLRKKFRDPQLRSLIIYTPFSRLVLSHFQQKSYIIVIFTKPATRLKFFSTRCWVATRRLRNAAIDTHNIADLSILTEPCEEWIEPLGSAESSFKNTALMQCKTIYLMFVFVLRVLC